MSRSLLIRFLLATGACATGLQPCSTSPAWAQGPDAIWKVLSGPLDPQPSSQPRAIHDSTRHEMVVVDGLNPGVLWVLSLSGPDSPQWRRLAVSGPTPIPRSNASAVFDSLRDRVVLFGGTSGDHSCNDVWTLALGSAPRWSPLLPSGAPPPPRASHAAILDPRRDRMIVYGGYSRDSWTTLGDTWELRLSGAPEWVELAPTGLTPGPRQSGAAVYDPWGDRMILFGGDETLWALSLGGPLVWDSLEVSTPRPAARVGSAAIVDPVQRSMILHAGAQAIPFGSRLSDTWSLKLDGPPEWHPLSTSGANPTVNQAAAIYSTERGSMIEFGGSPPTQANACDELDLGTLVWSRILPPAPDVFPSRRSGTFMTLEDPGAGLLALAGDYGCLEDLWRFGGDDAPAWTRLTMGGSPPDFCSFWSSFGFWTFVRDTKRNRVIGIHGDAWWGRTMNRIFELPLDGSREWRELFHQGPEPLGRYDPSLVYDPVRDRVLMFGGVIFGTRAADSGTACDDLWALSLGDTLRWTPLGTRGTPGRRDSHTAVYDAPRDRMVVFGGETQLGALLGDTRQPLYDTWALSLYGDSLVWNELSARAPTSGPAVLDVLHDRLVAWPGDSTLWALPLGGPGTWMRLTVEGDPPTPRLDWGRVFDATRNRMLVFGGRLLESGVLPTEVPAADLYELRFTEPISNVIALQGLLTAWDRVRLTWGGVGAGELMAIVRAEGDSAWIPIASAAADGNGRLEYTDREVFPGRAYGYGLAFSGGQQRFGETWTTIPPGPEFALQGLQPNPSGAQVSVGFTLPYAASARLQMVDVAGRRVIDRRLDGLHPGPQVLRLEEGRSLPPGLYFVRLTYGGRTLTARGVIVR